MNKAKLGWILLLIPIARAVLQLLNKTEYFPLLTQIEQFLNSIFGDSATLTAAVAGGVLLHKAEPVGR